MFASQPSERSSSVEWPTDSWMARNSCDGSTTMSYLPARDRLRLQLLDDFVTGLLGVLEPRVVFDVLVADQLGAVDDRAGLEVAAGAVGRRGGELRVGPYQPLRDARALARREIFLLVDEQQLRADERHAGHGQRRLVELHQERDLGVERHLERVALEARWSRWSRPLSASARTTLRVASAALARAMATACSAAARAAPVEPVGGRKAPRAVHQHAQAEAAAGRPRHVLDLALARGD